jgi:hypothetical protein
MPTLACRRARRAIQTFATGGIESGAFARSSFLINVARVVDVCSGSGKLNLLRESESQLIKALRFKKVQAAPGRSRALFTRSIRFLEPDPGEICEWI